MRKRGLTLSILLAIAAAAQAGENSGTTAAPILQIPVGARAASMGGAFTAVADDISTLYYNPAGLSNLDHRELSLMYQKGIDGQNIEYIAGGTPIPFTGLIGEGYTSLGASLLFAQNGDIEVNRTATDGSFLNSENISAGGDLVFTLGYSERAGETEIRKQGRIYRILHLIGVSGKVVRSTLAQRYSATAFAADIGYHVTFPDGKMRYGLSVLNLGTQMKFIEQGDPLPLTLRSGFAFSPELPESMALGEDRKLLIATDADYLVQEKQWHVNLGVEYFPFESYAFRLGYQINSDVGAITFGLGTDWRTLRVAYSWAMQSSLNDIHRLSLTYRFGRVPGYEREFRRRPYIESMPEREDLRGLEKETPKELDPPRRPRRQIPDNRRTVPGWIY